MSGFDPAQLELYAAMLSLLAVCFAIGIVAVMAGVGGGVLFVPLISAFFAIHVDYVRGAGLMVALVGAIAAAPHLLKTGLSEPRVSVPLALAGSIGSVVGARLGLAVPTDVILLILGVFMVLVAIQTGLTAFRDRGAGANDPTRREPEANHDDGPRRESPREAEPVGFLEGLLGLSGSYHDPRLNREVSWSARRTAIAAVLFVGIGAIGGMLGVGAGWANVPVLASVMTLPLKMAAATSGLVIVANSSAAAWVYVAEGAIRPMIVLPSLIGMIGGTRIGARLLGRVQPQVVRILVVVVLTVAGIRTLIGALG